ncbi:tetratricopeptide repeat protein [Aestuariibacter sp. AA17]|uniref:Tetratricopeptide repeat protein n=1 Tax=Fluctibacter corallii TaxID=2984329 RepID=A0ABT3A8V8_9ALTE|nr:tetratricopeptide repeat protein [Aestuariibacter sp. AA17]MCV2884746.1 tetratricopeptide repeat protein [Aestuariibacter sp. AA17]
MKPLYTVFCALSLTSVLLVSGCQSTHVQEVAAPVQVINDTAFPDHTLFAIESPDEIFALNEEARQFIRTEIKPVMDVHARMKTLARKIFDRTDFNLLYMASANTVASETFDNRAANCLSMSILTYSLAKEAGFEVKFQEVDIPEYWTRQAGFSLLNGHINLQMFPRTEVNVIHLMSSGLEVDFDPQPIRQHFPKRYVDKSTVLAMFYNNKGAEALLKASYSKAYAYFKEAVKFDAQFDSVWVNLGLLYRFNGFHQLAEMSYDHALAIAPGNMTAVENLAYLYRITGREQLADALSTKVELARKDNPYYHFILGEQAFEKALFDDALEHYRTALRLDRSKHEVYFGLAKVYYQLGDISRSQRYLERAKAKSRNDQDRERYQGKLNLFSKL